MRLQPRVAPSSVIATACPWIALIAITSQMSQCTPRCRCQPSTSRPQRPSSRRSGIAPCSSPPRGARGSTVSHTPGSSGNRRPLHRLDRDGTILEPCHRRRVAQQPWQLDAERSVPELPDRVVTQSDPSPIFGARRRSNLGGISGSTSRRPSLPEP